MSSMFVGLFMTKGMRLIFTCDDPQVTLAAWQEFDSQQEAVREFVNKARSTTERDLNFSSPESLAVELDQAGVRTFCNNYKNIYIHTYNVLFYTYNNIFMSPFKK